jgi:hypothetical protein
MNGEGNSTCVYNERPLASGAQAGNGELGDQRAICERGKALSIHTTGLRWPLLAHIRIGTSRRHSASQIREATSDTASNRRTNKPRAFVNTCLNI